MATWYSLPIEIQTMILKLLRSHNDGGTTSNYAAVSKEWQLYFERFNFRRLIIGQSCIPEFGRIVRQHRRAIVKHVWLRVELARYLCPACKWPERPFEITENNQTFTAALYQLFEILSTWKIGGRHGVSNGGLVLELSAYSPSDSEHFYSYPFGKDDYPHQYDENCTVDDDLRYKSRSEDGNHPLFSISHPSDTPGVCRLYGCFIELDYRKFNIPTVNRRLPSVSVVRRLLLRRRYPRSLHPDTLLNIFESLHGLESMVLEQLVHNYQCPDKKVQRGFGLFLRQIGSLKRLSIYGDHLRDFTSNLTTPYEVVPSLGWTLADESHSLEHLSIAFLVDARDFFQDFWPGYAPKYVNMSRSGVQRALMSRLSSSQRRALGKPGKSPSFERRLSKEFKRISGEQRIPYSIYKPTWPNLKSIALTSSLFDIATDSKAINSLLRAAAGAALEMPKLQTVEIFNGRSPDAFIFQYCRSLGGIPAVTLSSTWPYPLEPEVVSAWDRVGHKHGHAGHAIAVIRKRLQRPFSECDVIIVKMLKLQELILHPISLFTE